MGLKSTSIEKCIAGDVLASDVYGFNGNSLIVTKETELNDYIKERLINMGVTEVSIYEPKEKITKRLKGKYDNLEVYKETILATKKVFQEIVTGKTLDYEEILFLTDQIKLNMKDNQNVLHCMTYVSNADEYTFTHSVNVAFYSMLIAKWLKLSQKEIRNAMIAGLLHDVGKVMVPDFILNKAGKLTQEEFELMKKHTEYGYEIVNQMEDLPQDIKYTVLFHHERMDGSGYPFGYTGERLNLYSRIVAIADVFDAMTSKRVYKDPSTPFEVFEMLQKEGISTYDYKIMNVFTKNIANYLTGMEVLLSNQEAGQLVYVPLHNITRPVVRVSYGYLDLSKIRSINITKIMN